MSDDVLSTDPSEDPQHADLPEKLRVHSLARVLGTTSRRVLDALADLDGRIRSAHSSVDRVDAVRVRDLLVTATDTPAGRPADTPTDPAGEPESRLMLETTVVRAEYMPLFVAPQPVAAPTATRPAADRDHADSDADATDATDDTDDGQDTDDGDDVGDGDEGD
ncbi:MAG TPA: ribonuclease E/G, partial [Mycobacterium sp.]|nr:ribonuclease E/G [Mycobacterium sp.]